MTVSYPKRTLKRQENRNKLISAAVLLFSTEGYLGTTLEQVANAANLHVQTLYRQFKNKEALAISASEKVLNDCATRFAISFTERNTFQIWREWIENSVTYLIDMGLKGHKKKQLYSASSLMNDNFMLIIYSGYEDILTKYLAKDFQVNPQHDRLPRLVAGMLCSGNEAALKRCGGKDGSADRLDDKKFVIAESVAVVDDVTRLFGSSVKLPRPRNQ